MGNHIFRVESSILAAFRKFSNSSKEDITGTVQCRFAGIFKNTNDEAYADDLHGNIIADTKEAQATGIRRREPPATPEAPQAPTVEIRHRRSAVGRSTTIPNVLAAAKASTEMVMEAPAMLIVAPSGIEIVKVSGLRPSRLHKVRLTGIFAAELLVKNAYTPLSRIVVQTRG